MPVLRRAAAPALLLLLSILFYWKLTLLSQYTWLDSPDLASQVLPWWNQQARHWHSGNFPAWDPNLWGGQPLVGQAQPGAVYPLNWLLFNTRLKDGHLRPFYLNAYFILIHFIAALNCFLLARYLGRSRIAAILAGCLFAFGGYIGNIDWPQMINGVIWAPLVFLFLLRATSGIQPTLSAACCGFFLGFSWLSGHHQGPTFVTYAAGFTWLYFILRNRSWPIAKLAAIFLMFFVATAGLQIFPALEYGKLASRWVGSEQDPIDWSTAVPYYIHRTYSFGPVSLFGILIPGIHRQTSPLLGFAGFTLAVLAIALQWRIDFRVRLFTFLGLAGVLLALGHHSILHGILYTWAPMIEKARSPHAAMVLFSLSFSILAAYGFDQITDLREHPFIQRAIWILTALCTLILLAFATSAALRGMDAQAEDRPVMAAFLGLLLAAVLVAFRNSSITRAMFGTAIIALALTELSNEATYNMPNQLEPHTSPLKPLTSHDDIAVYLKTQAPQPVRVIVDDKLVPYNFGNQHGINQIYGYLASITSNHMRLDLNSDQGRDLFAITHSIGNQPPQPNWDLVFHSTSGINVYRNPRFPPRVWTVRTIMPLEKPTDARFVLNHKDMDVHKLMFVLGKPPVIPQGNTPCGTDSTKLLNYEPSRIVVEANMTCSGVLVLGDTYFPGWEAVVDGKPEPVLEVYGVVRGVVLSGGSHQVTFQYHNRPLQLGAISSLSALLGILILFVRFTNN